jgi:hypothetical protein
MNTIQPPTQLTYFVLTNTDQSIIQYGENETNQCTQYMVDNTETFTDKQLWIDRLDELGVDTSEL